MVSIEKSQSFIVIWQLPSVLVPDMMESVSQIEDSFFQREDIASLSVANRWLYNPKLIPFGAELKERYQQAQVSTSPIEWIPSPTRKIFRLAMIKQEQVQHGRIDDEFVRMTIGGNIDDILHVKTPVELHNIFKSEEVKATRDQHYIILIEGAPGSGKSTLTIHICQRWGKGELFEQFTVVILVQLRDPAVQRAQAIADLLPCEDITIAEELAAELTATNGRGVLWILDGWDELPSHLQQDSIFRQLMPPKPSSEELKKIEQDPTYHTLVEKKYSKEDLWCMYLQKNPVFRTQYYKRRLLNECSVIVTSRPISSGDLHPVVSSRIEVLGFTPEEQRQYFTECLKGDTIALESLIERIQGNPVVQSSCYLPLNAAFIAYIFKFKGHSLPNTEYEIFSAVIFNCVLRHFGQENRRHDLPVKLTSLDDLFTSEAVREPLQLLCELAYRGIMENKVTFASSELLQGIDTLSLLQGIESFLQNGKSVYYSFLHLSFQEFLAAYYIATCLPSSEQVSQFQQLFDQPRFSGVFQFYSAITKLQNPGIKEVITRIVKRNSKSLLVSLIHCLFEAQDLSLCHYVAEQLDKWYGLNFSSIFLSQLDFLYIGYFLSTLTTQTVKRVGFDHCNINDDNVKNLALYMCRSSSPCGWRMDCLLYTSPSPRDATLSRMPSSA